ncbi:hypothetical protein [Paenibacillus antibioticophila]|uniref:hypothetical protein n=1 Tax=Paenibacillus antibioticophila TaxID=1274374 RepID=UPI000A57A315|nr:hypothetical protein [Paenibacillus antibioticophila]
MAEHKSAVYESAIIIIEKRLKKADFQGLKKPEKLRFFVVSARMPMKKGIIFSLPKGKEASDIPFKRLFKKLF